jgi:predicted  nucleic acid-binding Zn-ribbon protein
MNADLERVLTLQRLDSSIHDAERTLADEPSRLQAIDTRLEGARHEVAAAKTRFSENQAARRDIEKELAVHQSRLSKFRDQAMAVKTNQEYHAIQHEIAFAQNEIKTHEDRILERMVEADDLAAAVKRAEAVLTTTTKEADAERRAIATEHDQLRASVERLKSDRLTLVASLPQDVLAVFELVSRKRGGIAVAEAKDGICTICHVRMRPQVFNNILRNDSIIQCDSCQRILYFRPAAPTAAGETAS